jgi:phosphodiesterase/alkaline phosphatase D-like protein
MSKLPEFPGLSRRSFLALGAIAAAVSACGRWLTNTPQVIDGSFSSTWQWHPDRVWVGAEYWANPLQDWSIKDGRLETVFARPNSNLQLLTHQLGDLDGDFRLSVALGAASGNGEFLKGSVGFLLGAHSPLNDYRSNLLSHDSGIVAGISADGYLFIDDATQPIELPATAITLVLTATYLGAGYELALEAYGEEQAIPLETLKVTNISARQLRGNLALATNHRRRKTLIDEPFASITHEDNQSGRFWFSDWQVSGAKIAHNPEQTFGPILFSHYTLSRGTLKLTAQMPPIGDRDNQEVSLQLYQVNEWQTIAHAPIDPDAFTARFRVDNWDDEKQQRYRFAYDEQTKDGVSRPNYWEGIIQKDPLERVRLSVADISCNTHAAFPNSLYTENVAGLQPDLITFVGDQFYEASGGYGIEIRPLSRSMLDLMRRWYLHGWTWRELTRNTPSVCLPDDHDVLQGNIWGMGGRVGSQEKDAFKNDDESGYEMRARWVNMVHRTQTSHHPDAYYAEPSIDGISNYFGELIYGGVSFAILADRMYKSGPKEFAPPTSGERADHVLNPGFDPKSADTAGAELLGEKQLEFLKSWAADWSGAVMKAVVSQTIFTSMATTHGLERMRLVADYDSNGWPQTARDTALREIRKAFAFHIAGDQHLPAVVQYGVDEHRDSVYAFAGPAVNVGYPRWFEPEESGSNPFTDVSPNTGDFDDRFGNPMTVVAYANGAEKPRQEDLLQFLNDKASGIGMVHFDKDVQSITVECWPLLANPGNPNQQFPGWPVALSMLDNYEPRNAEYLPTIRVPGTDRPVFQVVNEDQNETTYTVRINNPEFQPRVGVAGHYTIIVGDPESGEHKILSGLRSAQLNNDVLTVKL